MRIGHGYDVHRLVEGRRLILGGVEIPYEKGLLGHSDADVLAHAVADALLGAAALGDIGGMFPDTDPAFQDADSLVLLRRVTVAVEAAGFRIENIDATVLAPEAQAQGLYPRHAGEAGRRLRLERGAGQCQGHHRGGAGLYRRREGMAAHAVCLLEARGESA